MLSAASSFSSSFTTSLHGNPHVISGVPSDVLMGAYLDGTVAPLLDCLAATPGGGGGGAGREEGREASAI